ncbi:unnamed protein product [Toxocara canis]|uniref:Tyrosine-protein phosphatase domain-containing protein n=1 Tax=Toxocara canis TaxID=6265 RepID=A0A183V2E0_TOXCA|nr:unnamed protein product [Toxocara canis]
MLFISGIDMNPTHEVDTASADSKWIVISDIKMQWSGESRKIRHYRWLDWLDRGVPPSGATPFRLYHEVKRTKTPIVIHYLMHCSAGVGRTGTIVSVIERQLRPSRMSIGLFTFDMASERSSITIDLDRAVQRTVGTLRTRAAARTQRCEPGTNELSTPPLIRVIGEGGARGIIWSLKFMLLLKFTPKQI